MFYRKKQYLVKNELVDVLNDHFTKTNLPNQLKHGTRLIGGWMKADKNGTIEIFAIWEYDSYEDYVRIETNIRADQAHVARIQKWYEQLGGREHVLKEFILEVNDEALESTV
ncbi:hypothetical protein HNO89_002802 [Sporosarcina luteola]|nr:hypothetical protein [Sporosarcina luteola]